MRKGYLAKHLARLAEDSGDPSVRFDANETAFLERELTQRRAKLYEVQYPDNVAMSLLPIATDIASWADTHSTPVLDRSGQAKIIGNGVKDIPRVDVKKDEILGKVKTVGASYGFELMELRKAAALQIPLESWKGVACRAEIDAQIDHILATGRTTSQPNVDFGLTGFLNNAAITPVTNEFTVWSLADSSDALLAELGKPAARLNAALKNKSTLLPDTLALAPEMYDIIATKQVANTTVTVLNWFKANNPYIKNVVQWTKLSLANAAGDGPRAVMYRRDPLVIEGVVPLAFEQLPPQAVGLELISHCIGRCGGVKNYHPEAVTYLDHTG